MTVRIIKKPDYIENKKNLKDNHLWVWHGEIECDVCDKIIQSANDEWRTGKVGFRDGDINLNVRSTDIHFGSQEWIYNLIRPYMKEPVNRWIGSSVRSGPANIGPFGSRIRPWVDFDL